MATAEPHDRTGVWLVGARGSVATTALVGASALAAGLVEDTALVTERHPFDACGLVDWDDLVFGGHDVADIPLVKRSDHLVDAGVIPAYLSRAVSDQLALVDERIRRGVTSDDGEEPRATIARLRADLTEFAAAHHLSRVVVVNVASTEAVTEPAASHGSLAALDLELARGAAVLPPSSMYAYAALSDGHGYIDFTPSLGARIPALDALAHRNGAPYAGSDGKTGQTLLKTALAPMFADRALRVRSWAGVNLLGGGDGATLATPERSAAKLRSKARALDAILGYPVDSPMHIDNVPDFGDWKTSWDHVSFEGFLGTRMRLQFTWEGCDSALAAPLVLDLARLVDRAAATGQAGALTELGYFFKDPVGTGEHRLDRQYAALCNWALDTLVPVPE